MKIGTIKKNIIFSFILKFIGIGISFIMFPMTIHYLNQVEYGIWVTLFSVMNWINVLDVGIGLGLRNKLTEAIGKNDLQEIREYISTSFATISAIGLIIFICFYIGIQFVSLQSVFNTQDISESELYTATLWTGIFVILAFVLSLINQIYYAYQQAAVTGAIQVLHSLIMLAIVYYLILQTEHELVYFIFSFGIATLFSRIFFIAYFFFSHREVTLRFIDIKFAKIKAISGLGIKFFIMQLACIFGFYSSNILITQLLGPEYVRSYDVVFKIFSFLTMAHTLVLTPLWSAYTYAYVTRDFLWIKRTLRKTNWLVGILAVAAIILCFSVDRVIGIWIGMPIEKSASFVALVSLYTILLMWNNNYAYLLNGIGKVDVQMIGWILGAGLVVPLSFLFTKFYGLGNEGIILALIACLLINSIITPIHVYRIMKQECSPPNISAH